MEFNAKGNQALRKFKQGREVIRFAFGKEDTRIWALYLGSPLQERDKPKWLEIKM